MEISVIQYKGTAIDQVLDGVSTGQATDTTVYQNVSTDFCGGFYYLKKNDTYHKLAIHNSDIANCIKNGILANNIETYATGIPKGCGLTGDNLDDWQSSLKLDPGTYYVGQDGVIYKSDRTSTNKTISKVTGFIAVAGGGAGGRTGNAYAGQNHSAGSGGAGGCAYGIIQTYGFVNDQLLWISVGSGGSTSSSVGGTGTGGGNTIFKLSTYEPTDWSDALLTLTGGSAGGGAYIQTSFWRWEWKYIGGAKGKGGGVTVTNSTNYIQVAGQANGGDGVDGNWDCYGSGTISTTGINYTFGPTSKAAITYDSESRGHTWRTSGGCSLIGYGGYSVDTGYYTSSGPHYAIISLRSPSYGGGGAGGLRMYSGWYGNNNGAETGTAGGNGVVFFFS